MQPVLDELEFVARISLLDRKQKTVLAATCAERLRPFYGLGHAQDEALRLVSDLEAVWKAAEGEEIDLASHAASAQALVPDEEVVDWSWEHALAQNAAAAVAYAARTWMSGGERECLWGCRQIFEAADYAAGLDESTPNVTRDAERRLAEHPYVVEVVKTIWCDLVSVETTDPGELARNRSSLSQSSWIRGLAAT